VASPGKREDRLRLLTHAHGFCIRTDGDPGFLRAGVAGHWRAAQRGLGADQGRHRRTRAETARGEKKVLRAGPAC
jgi:hypothetical protein